MISRGQLRDYFIGVGAKLLSAVDADSKVSNQHEVGTTAQMRSQFLGNVNKKRYVTNYVWLGSDRDSTVVRGASTHYDARHLRPNRSPEWRIYYQSNEVTEKMRKDDALFLALAQDGSLYFIIAAGGSTEEQQLCWLFDISPVGRRFVSREVKSNEPYLNYSARFIFDILGVELKLEDPGFLDSIVCRYNKAFPSTREFSDLARRTLSGICVEEDPDSALVSWLSHEEALFRRLERKIVSSRIDRGFLTSNGSIDVDAFISYSLSVQNRRKSRMGWSLEHHLEAIFRAHKISFERGVITEYNHRPDFLFPSQAAYRSAGAADHWRLAMLGAKSSCKDRWRQVLAEAEKISEKHLLTLEPGISAAQTQQMQIASLQLVVPTAIQETYSDDQRAWLWTLMDFISEIKARAAN